MTLGDLFASIADIKVATIIVTVIGFYLGVLFVKLLLWWID